MTPHFTAGRTGTGIDRIFNVDFDAYALDVRKIAARRTIYREGEAVREFALVLDGWAFQFKLLPDGRRQIISIVLPGEPIALHTLWSDRLSFSVQSLTELQLRVIDREKLVGHMQEDGGFAMRLGQTITRELAASEERLTNLGRRTATERIARLILMLHDSLKFRGLVEGQIFPFPLRQEHIADALGMTSVHVSRVFSELRAMKLIGRVRDAIEILDYPKLADIAGP